jgi:hypothetical protein
MQNTYLTDSPIYLQMKRDDTVDFIYINHTCDPLEICLDIIIEKEDFHAYGG